MALSDPYLPPRLIETGTIVLAYAAINGETLATPPFSPWRIEFRSQQRTSGAARIEIRNAETLAKSPSPAPWRLEFAKTVRARAPVAGTPLSHRHLRHVCGWNSARQYERAREFQSRY